MYHMVHKMAGYDQMGVPITGPTYTYGDYILVGVVHNGCAHFTQNIPGNKCESCS